MSLVKPILRATPAFDAENGNVFTFSVSGGDIFIGSRLQIFVNDETKQKVFDSTYTSYQYQFELTAEQSSMFLRNGGYYFAQIQTYNNTESSDFSAPIQFHCYDSGVLILDTVPTVGSSSYEFSGSYNTATSTNIVDTVQSYSFTLTDINNQVISTSGTQYVQDSTLPIIFKYIFGGLVDGNTYKVRLHIATVEGMNIPDVEQQFVVRYITPSAYSKFEAKNVCEEGYIQITSNIVAIDGIVSPPPPIYIAGKELDVTANGASVLWNDGYNVSGDFTFELWGRKFTTNQMISFLSSDADALDDQHRIEIYKRIGIPFGEEEDKLYFEARIYSGNANCGYIYSNFIAIPEDDEQIYLVFRRNNNVFDLAITNQGVII